MGGKSGSSSLRSPEPVPVSAHSGNDPGRIAASLSPAERRAMMHRELAAEACMSWEVAQSLYDRGLTLRNARFLRLTYLGHAVRKALQCAEGIDD
jgi:hypothetical protein